MSLFSATKNIEFVDFWSFAILFWLTFSWTSNKGAKQLRDFRRALVTFHFCLKEIDSVSKWNALAFNRLRIPFHCRWSVMKKNSFGGNGRERKALLWYSWVCNLTLRYLRFVLYSQLCPFDVSNFSSLLLIFLIYVKTPLSYFLWPCFQYILSIKVKPKYKFP